MPSSSPDLSDRDMIDTYFPDERYPHRRRHPELFMETPVEQWVPAIFQDANCGAVESILEKVGEDVAPPKKSNLPRALGALAPGARFRGRQSAPESSGSVEKSYSVEVEIKVVDLQQSLLCGYLTIHNLTREFPVLTTFFEGEIVGPNYGFITGKWEADATIDKKHWERFDYFRQNCGHFLGGDSNAPPPQTRSAPATVTGTSDSSVPYRGAAIAQRTRLLPRLSEYQYASTSSNYHHHQQYNIQENGVYDYLEEPVVFMRWKEYFLVPDHHVESVTGASYAGFYYMAYDKSSKRLEGFYYHRESKDYQKLELDYDERKTFGAFEFR